MVDVLYIDPSLRSDLGHHANVCAAIAGALRSKGHRVEVLISSKAKPHLDGHRVLRNDVYRHLSLDPSNNADQRRLRTSVAEFCGETIPRLARFRPQIVYAHSVGAVACEGILRAISTVFESDRRPMLIAELPFPCENKDGYFYGEQLRAMFARLSAREPHLLSRFAPVTVNAETSRLLSSAVEYPIETMPSPYAISRQRAACAASPERPIRIGSVGHQSTVKGFELLPEIFHHLRHVDRPVEFVVQIQRDSDPETVATLRRAQAAGMPLRLIEQDLDRDQYESLLHELDVMLLPYQPARYISAISGVCYESLALGIVVIAPEQTTIGGLIRQFHPHAPLFQHWNATSIATALRTAIDSFDSLSGEAQHAVDRYYETEGPLCYADEVVSRACQRPVLSIMGKTPMAAKTLWTARKLLRCG